MIASLFSSLVILALQTLSAGPSDIQFDQQNYTWTSLVHISVYAPDFDFDPNLVDTIQVTVSTRGNTISPYILSETGTNTGIFVGDITLTGDPKLKGTLGVDGQGTNPTGLQGGVGPKDGFLPAENSDGVTVSFEYTKDKTVTGSALIEWNVGKIEWLQQNYPVNGQGVLQIVDPDMNLNPKAIDSFETNVWSDSDSGGIKVTMTETGPDTGIFQGTVYFTTTHSSGSRLFVSDGDTVTGEYVDRTLPSPYSTADSLRLIAKTTVGTIIPPLEQVQTSNPQIVDSLGNLTTNVKTGQQILITTDLKNTQQKDQPFTYLVQIEDANGVTISLSWISGTLAAEQLFSPAQSWTPTSPGTYAVQIFVWQSIAQPNALAPPLSTTINVS